MVHEYRQRRALLFPLTAFFGLVIALLTHSVPLGVLCALGLGVSAIVVIPLALTGRAKVTDGALTVEGSPPYSRSQKHPGPVRLNHLAAIHSVAQRYAGFTRLGPSILRPLIRLQDQDGTEVVMWAWGWEQKAELFELLRRAALQSNARVDRVSIQRLHLKG